MSDFMTTDIIFYFFVVGVGDVGAASNVVNMLITKVRSYSVSLLYA